MRKWFLISFIICADLFHHNILISMNGVYITKGFTLSEQIKLCRGIYDQTVIMKVQMRVKRMSSSVSFVNQMKIL